MLAPFTRLPGVPYFSAVSKQFWWIAIMGDEPAAQTAELRLLLSVRDRLHLADVIRTLKRSWRVLRVARIKP